MDLHLPWEPGLRPIYCGARAITEIRERWPAAKVAVITMFEDQERMREALKAGALSYVSKDDEPHEMIHVVHLAARGNGVLNKAASEFVTRNLPHSPNGSTSFPELTPRENEQLGVAAAGANDKEIAKKLGLSEKSVANNWSNIRRNLGMVTREEAVEMARANGFRPSTGDSG